MKDTRIKFKEIIKFIKNLRIDYKKSNNDIKIYKKKAIFKTIKLTLIYIWSGITAPFIYPIWYLFRKQICNKVYENSSWQEVHKLIEENKIIEAKSIIKKHGNFIYWLWTYGDLRDPLGRGELPDNVINNNFKTRYYENAIRNARFIINYIDFRSGTILEVFTIIDTRDFKILHSSEGIGSAPSGIIFKWMIDDRGDWIFIYDDNNINNLFYFGYSGLNKKDIGNNGRFEIGYRKN